MRQNPDDSTSGLFVLTVAPVFPRVYIDSDPEFNAIHQKRSNQHTAKQFVTFLKRVLGERKLAMAQRMSNGAEDTQVPDSDLYLLWSNKEWSWLDDIVPNELPFITDDQVCQLNEQFHVVLIGDPVPHYTESTSSSSQRPQIQGFDPLFRVLEELSQAYFIRIHNVRQEDGHYAKQVKVFC